MPVYDKEKIGDLMQKFMAASEREAKLVAEANKAAISQFYSIMDKVLEVHNEKMAIYAEMQKARM